MRVPSCDPAQSTFRASDTQGTRYAALLDFVAQQAAWWACVLLVRHGFSASAALPSLLVAAGAVWTRGRPALLLGALAAAIGFALDTALIQLGSVSFPSRLGAHVTTAWMVGLWAALGTAFTGSLAWLQQRGVLLAAGLGGVAGLFAYRAGAALGVLNIDRSVSATLFIGAGWALAIAMLRVAALRACTAPNPERS